MPYKNIENTFHPLLNSYSNIFFISGLFSSSIILLITLINYNVGASGILSMLAAYLMARLLNQQELFLTKDYFGYNALLVGLAIGYMFELSPLSLLLIGIAGALSTIITIITAQVFFQLFGLQVLSVSFIIVSILVYLSSSSFNHIFVANLYTQTHSLNLNIFPFWLAGYLKSLGTIIFMPNEITGLLIALLLIINSRILFLLSLSGYLFGIGLHGLFIGSMLAASLDLSSFNYILIAMAIGGIFNIPSLKSYTLAFMGVAFGTLIMSAGQVLLSQHGLPVFTLPFALVTLSFIYTLKLLNYPLLTHTYKGTPEKNLEYYLSTKERYVTMPAAVSLPFKGRWYCWQGFNGEWTHKGAYQYAYDFVICDSEKKTYLEKGLKLDDYLCFGKEVISPVCGRVIKVINYLPDNPIGTIDLVNNWGNEVIIEDYRGYIVKLAHFSTNSICVAEGQWLEVGELLGSCGNSGNSPQPHIHIQMQYDYTPAATTREFVFVNYQQNDMFYVSGLPRVHSDITNREFNPYYDQVTNFVLDETLRFNVLKNNELIETISICVKMSDSSCYYFEYENSKLYFGKEYGKFYFYNIDGESFYLKLIFLALSTMPLSYSYKLKWTDNINNSLLLNKWQSYISGLLNSINADWVKTKVEYKYQDETTINGKIINKVFNIELDTHIEIDPINRFNLLSVGDYKFIKNK